MRGLGQIAELAAIARPRIGVITSIAPVHLELLGTVESVARAKAELVAALPPGGTAVVPAGEPLLEPYLRDDVDDRPLRRRRRRPAVEFAPPRLVADVAGERVTLEVPFTARHQARNTLPALAAYRALGLPLERAVEGAREIAFSRWRGEERELPGGGLLINDAYNANPVSMRAALPYLARARRGPAHASPCSARWPSSGRTRPRTTARSARPRPSSASTSSPSGTASRASYGGTLVRQRRRGGRARPRAAAARRRRARQGVAAPSGSRGSRRRSRGRARLTAVVRVLAATLVALVISIVVGPKFIEFLRRRELGQHIREEGPEGHHVKQGTPTMGGVLILLAASIPFLAPLAATRCRRSPSSSSRSPAARSASSTTSSSSRTAARSGSRAAGRCSCSRSITRRRRPARRTTGALDVVYMPLLDWSLPLGGSGTRSCSS